MSLTYIYTIYVAFSLELLCTRHIVAEYFLCGIFPAMILHPTYYRRIFLFRMNCRRVKFLR